jgi:hypothetical protein
MEGLFYLTSESESGVGDRPVQAFPIRQIRAIRSFLYCDYLELAEIIQTYETILNADA